MKKLYEYKRINYFNLELEVRADHNWIVTDSSGFVKTSELPFTPNINNGIWISKGEVVFVCKVDLEGLDWKTTLLPLSDVFKDNPFMVALKETKVATNTSVEPPAKDTISSLLEKAFNLALEQGLILGDTEFNFVHVNEIGKASERVVLVNVELNTRSLVKYHE